MRTQKMFLFVLVLLPFGCQKNSITITENPQDLGVEFRAAEKLLVCHNTGSETNPWELIEVAEIAYVNAHQEHGDAQPGEAIPGMPGYKFGCNCEVEEAIETIVMDDGKTWTAKNLEFVPEGFESQTWWPQDEFGVEHPEYGLLYTWAAATEACLQLGDGWRLPTDQEWYDMTAHYGTWITEYINDGAYEKLIEGVDSRCNGLLGGIRLPDGSFYELETYARYWSSTTPEQFPQYAWYYYFYRDQGELYRSYDNKAFGFSCRCLKDD